MIGLALVQHGKPELEGWGDDQEWIFGSAHDNSHTGANSHPSCTRILLVMSMGTWISESILYSRDSSNTPSPRCEVA